MEIAKIHPLAQVEGPFGISEKLQDIMCKIGQSQVFEDGEELLLELLDIPVSGKQIQRVSEYYGEQIEEKQKASIEKGEPAPMLENKDETVYVMACLLYTSLSFYNHLHSILIWRKTHDALLNDIHKDSPLFSCDFLESVCNLYQKKLFPLSFLSNCLPLYKP